MTNTTRPLRLAIVNDYEIVVQGLASMFAAHSDRVHVVELDNREPVVSDVDVVLLDAFGYVPGDGMDVADLVRPGGPKVVVFSVTPDPRAVERARADGAAGYVSKSLSAEELIETLEAIHAGEQVFPDPELAAEENIPTDGAGATWPGAELGLSARESEMMALIAKGMSNQEIASTVYLSINSVKTYIRTAYAKIGVNRRSQATRWALEHGFGVTEKRVFTEE
ncbi:response regulator transcription factor [Nocardioides sp. cx-173]|uniref:response regulator transcription factor n=1 Tax=Nocardioides sp. cx-173 TaxID=2898796 RepID=UPI001E4C7D6B|nr:response regulator transcription factor [Nocardioides sp. cx-173]MCD4523546.1 response regulator transcription factor [Nocardioides sp. cx-173]UGB42116.1 response regulator transcription factor [Nocardioides sp. cx-173]